MTTTTTTTKPTKATSRTSSADAPEDAEAEDLSDLLNEARMLLPGTEVFLGFLMTMPFTARFGELSDDLRVAYLFTFFTTLVALVCFVLPAAYHRINRPIHDKARFKRLANLFLVAGLVPLSVAIVLVTWLITSVVMPSVAWVGTAFMLVAIGSVWWLVPLSRAHDRIKPKRARVVVATHTYQPNKLERSSV